MKKNTTNSTSNDDKASIEEYFIKVKKKEYNGINLAELVIEDASLTRSQFFEILKEQESESKYYLYDEYKNLVSMWNMISNAPNIIDSFTNEPDFNVNCINNINININSTELTPNNDNNNIITSPTSNNITNNTSSATVPTTSLEFIKKYKSEYNSVNLAELVIAKPNLTLSEFIQETNTDIDTLYVDRFWNSIEEDKWILLDDEIIRWLGLISKINDARKSCKRIILQNELEYKEIPYSEVRQYGRTSHFETKGENNLKQINYIIIPADTFKAICMMINNQKGKEIDVIT
jgi:hypothetical protein